MESKKIKLIREMDIPVTEVEALSEFDRLLSAIGDIAGRIPLQQQAQQAFQIMMTLRARVYTGFAISAVEILDTGELADAPLSSPDA